MKRIFFFLLLALFPFAVGAQTFNMTSSATVTVGPFFYAGTSASTTIANATLTPTTQISFKLIKPDLSINPFIATTSGDNRCTALASGWYQLEIEAAQKSQVGLYQVIAEASGCINPAPATFFQVLPDAVYVRDYVTEPIGGWIASASSSGNAIPETGMTLTNLSVIKTGERDSNNLMIRGLSYSSATPTIQVAVHDDGGAEIGYATQSAFTHIVSEMEGVDANGRTVYKHAFTRAISEPAGWYQIITAIQKNNLTVGGVSTLIIDPTPEVEIDESNLVTLPTWNSFVTGVTETFNKQGSGILGRVQIYEAESVLDRSIAGVSSWSIRHVTSGVPYGYRMAYFDEITGATNYTNVVFDYSESTEQRIAAYAITQSVTEWAIIEGVTVSELEEQ